MVNGEASWHISLDYNRHPYGGKTRTFSKGVAKFRSWSVGGWTSSTCKQLLKRRSAPIFDLGRSAGGRGRGRVLRIAHHRVSSPALLRRPTLSTAISILIYHGAVSLDMYLVSKLSALKKGDHNKFNRT